MVAAWTRSPEAFVGSPSSTTFGPARMSQLPDGAAVAGRPLVRWTAWSLALCVFGVLVTANSAGYRYGASDQAFYIPVVQNEVTPALFPDDSALIEAQGRFSLSDEVLAAVVRTTGVSLPVLFLAGYVLSTALFAVAILSIGRHVYASWWGSAALLLALTLRHRVMGTGVNTFEGYFHPRVLAFALGLCAVAAVLRRRRLLAAVLVAGTLVAHPTTGVWFGVWLGVAVVVERHGVRALLPIAAAGSLLLAAAGIGVLGGLWRLMDPPWLSVLASKPYLFPTGWALDTWLVNALAPIVAVVLYRVRLGHGLVSPAERGIFVGCATLFAMFVASLPFIAERVALAVQLQTSRVLWQVEVLATVYLVWAIVAWSPRRVQAVSAWRAPALVAVLLACSLGRGLYVLEVQFDRPLVQAQLPSSDWQRMTAWAAAHTPVDAQFLVHPEHAPMYGFSFRVGASRDVFLEAAKDAAIATYSPEIAARVRERSQAVLDFDRLTPAQIEQIARRYGLEYLVTERQLPLPLVHRDGRFRAYALSHAPRRAG